LLVAQSALTNLNTALASGSATQIAAAVIAAQQAVTNLNTTIGAEVTANAQLNTAISASAGNAQSTQSQTSQSQTTTTTAVTPAGAIAWAPGFGPNGVVASVQTAPTAGATETTTTPTAVAGVQTAPQSSGVSNLPSTNTGDTSGLLGLGSALVAPGASVRLRLPTKPRK